MPGRKPDCARHGNRWTDLPQSLVFMDEWAYDRKRGEERFMMQIEEIIRNTTEDEQEKVDWTRALSARYPVLGTYQK